MRAPSKVGGKSSWSSTPETRMSPVPPFCSLSLTVTLNVLFPLLTMLPSRTLPENLPRRVVIFHLPAKIAEAARGAGNGSCCTATQKKPGARVFPTTQSHVPVKIAASHPDCAHNSTPEISPVIAGLDAIAGRTAIKDTAQTNNNSIRFISTPPLQSVFGRIAVNQNDNYLQARLHPFAEQSRSQSR